MRATPSQSSSQSSSPTEPTNRAARRAAKRGRAATGGSTSRVPLREGHAGTALTKPVHARADYAARRSG